MGCVKGPENIIFIHFLSLYQHVKVLTCHTVLQIINTYCLQGVVYDNSSGFYVYF